MKVQRILLGEARIHFKNTDQLLNSRYQFIAQTITDCIEKLTLEKDWKCVKIQFDLINNFLKANQQGNFFNKLICCPCVAIEAIYKKQRERVMQEIPNAKEGNEISKVEVF